MLLKTLPLSLILFSLILVSCGGKSKDTPDNGTIMKEQKVEKNLKIITYNVENLFDSEHHNSPFGDPLADWDFTPLNFPGKQEGCFDNIMTNGNPNWGEDLKNKLYDRCIHSDYTKEKFSQKLKNIARVITNDQKEELPDILAVTEVTSEKSVRELAKVLNYDSYFKTNNFVSTRGLNVAIFYNKTNANLKVDKLQIIKSPVLGTYRDLLLLNMTFNGTKLALLLTHYPAPYNPKNEREFYTSFILSAVSSLKNEGYDNIIVTGDFNTIQSEEPYINQLYENRDLIDGLNYFDSPTSETSLNSKGTYFYEKDESWSRLDHFYFSRELEPSVKSVNTIVRDFATLPYKGEKIPFATDLKTNDLDKFGFSDHFPIEISIEI